jgi:hypothetical protein
LYKSLSDVRKPVLLIAPEAEPMKGRTSVHFPTLSR